MLGTVAAALLPVAAGCTRVDVRGKGFDDETSNWTKKLRPAADESKFSGVDARSREIERNLGVR